MALRTTPTTAAPMAPIMDPTRMHDQDHDDFEDHEGEDKDELGCDDQSFAPEEVHEDSRDDDSGYPISNYLSDNY